MRKFSIEITKIPFTHFFHYIYVTEKLHSCTANGGFSQSEPCNKTDRQRLFSNCKAKKNLPEPCNSMAFLPFCRLEPCKRFFVFSTTYLRLALLTDTPQQGCRSPTYYTTIHYNQLPTPATPKGKTFLW